MNTITTNAVFRKSTCLTWSSLDTGEIEVGPSDPPDFSVSLSASTASFSPIKTSASSTKVRFQALVKYENYLIEYTYESIAKTYLHSGSFSVSGIYDDSLNVPITIIKVTQCKSATVKLSVIWLITI